MDLDEDKTLLLELALELEENKLEDDEHDEGMDEVTEEEVLAMQRSSLMNGELHDIFSSSATTGSSMKRNLALQ